MKKLKIGLGMSVLFWGYACFSAPSSRDLPQEEPPQQQAQSDVYQQEGEESLAEREDSIF